MHELRTKIVNDILRNSWSEPSVDK